MIALNAWWTLTTETAIAQNGLRVTRAAMRHGNAEHGTDPLPAAMLSRRDAAGVELMLVLFADGSAVVARSSAPVTREMDAPHDQFWVLPIVLQLAPRVKLESGDTVTLKMRKPRGETQPTLVLGPEKTMTVSRRKQVEDALMAAATAWAARIARLPALHLPEIDHGYAHEGVMGRRISRQFKLDPAARTPYATPAFLPYRGYSTDEGAAYCDLLANVALWLLLVRAPADIGGVDVTLMGAQLRQTPGDTAPFGSVHAYDANLEEVNEAQSAALTRDLMALIHSDRAPVPAHRLIDQVMRRTPRRTVSLTLSPGLIGFSDARRDRLSPSSHEILALRGRFNPVVDPVTAIAS